MRLLYLSNWLFLDRKLFLNRGNFFLVSGNVIGFQPGRSQTAQERLGENLLKNYSKNSRPVIDPNSPLNLSFGFELIKIYEVVCYKFFLISLSKCSFKTRPCEYFSSHWPTDLACDTRCKTYPCTCLYKMRVDAN